MAISSHVYNSKFWKPTDIFLTNSKLFYVYLHHKSEKVHGTFGLCYDIKGRNVKSKVVYCSFFCRYYFCLCPASCPF